MAFICRQEHWNQARYGTYRVNGRTSAVWQTASKTDPFLKPGSWAHFYGTLLPFLLPRPFYWRNDKASYLKKSGRSQQEATKWRSWPTAKRFELAPFMLRRHNVEWLTAATRLIQQSQCGEYEHCEKSTLDVPTSSSDNNPCSCLVRK